MEPSSGSAASFLCDLGYGSLGEEMPEPDPWLRIPALPLMDCVNLGKSLSLSVS